MVNWGMGYEFLSLLPFSYPSFIASPVLFPHYSVKIKRFVQHLNCILHLAFDNIYINYRKKFLDIAAIVFYLKQSRKWISEQ